MNREEAFLRQFDKKQPFRVPEGYFENFADHMMEQLPERESRVVELHPRSRWYIPVRVAVAACFCAIIINTGIWLNNTIRKSSGDLAATAQPLSSSYDSAFDQMADYTMLDNGDIYAYVSDYYQ